MRSMRRGTRTYCCSIQAGQWLTEQCIRCKLTEIRATSSTIPKDIRRSAIERFELTNPPDEEEDEQDIDGSELVAPTGAGADEVRSDEEVDGKGWVRKKVDQVKTKRRKKSKNKGKVSEVGGTDININGKGKAEWEVKPVKALSAFRVNLGALR
jgi:hypothetical protein